MEEKFTLDEMYTAVTKLLKDGELIGCDTPVPTLIAPDSRYALAFTDIEISLVDGRENRVVASIPWESQLGGLICCAVLSEPIHAHDKERPC